MNSKCMQCSRPILFSAPMVRAILDGRKTQTRRTMKPTKRNADGVITIDGEPYNMFGDLSSDDNGVEWPIKCPYGKVGDRLWVRETWAVGNIYDGIAPSRICDDIPKGPGKPPCGVAYPASGGCVGLKGRPSIHMPRWASRITLEITDLRAERLNAISEDDAIAEGYPGTTVEGRHVPWSPLGWYAALWDSINGDGTWDLNPLVWVVEFQRVEAK